MKKILFVIPTLSGGGAEKVLVNLVNNLSSEMFEVTVQTVFDTGVHRNKLNSNIKYIPGPFKKQFRGNIYFLKLFTPKFLFRKLIKDDYDIIVSFLEGPTARIVSGCNTSAKLICWIHVEQENMKRAARSFRSKKEAINCYSRFDHIVCVAETVKEDFKKIFDVNIPVSVLYNVNDTNDIIKKSHEKNEDVTFSNSINVISVGRLMSQKGYDRLIKVHRKLISEGLYHHIFILGEGIDRPKLERLIQEKSVEKTFHLLGFRTNPYKYMKEADLFVCSSRREGFSTVVTESLILGLPIITTRCSGMTELLGENDEYGIIVSNNEKGLYTGLKRILSDPELICKYRNIAEQRGQNYEMKKTLEQIELFFQNKI